MSDKENVLSLEELDALAKGMNDDSIDLAMGLTTPVRAIKHDLINLILDVIHIDIGPFDAMNIVGCTVMHGCLVLIKESLGVPLSTLCITDNTLEPNNLII